MISCKRVQYIQSNCSLPAFLMRSINSLITLGSSSSSPSLALSDSLGFKVVDVKVVAVVLGLFLVSVLYTSGFVVVVLVTVGSSFTSSSSVSSISS